MKIKSIVISAAMAGLASSIAYAQNFHAMNLTSERAGIYILFNQSPASFPSDCVQVTGTCCKFSSNDSQFSISGPANFNIAANQCGSSGYAQAEFTLGATGVCGTQHACDIVDISTVQSSTPSIIIVPSNGSTINSQQFTCGVYGPGNPNCAAQQPKQTTASCPNNNYCTLNYYGSQTYTITFQ